MIFQTENEWLLQNYLQNLFAELGMKDAFYNHNMTSIPVSYTHLDVYKRQENWAGPYTIFQNDGSFWADSQYWAPEVYYICLLYTSRCV